MGIAFVGAFDGGSIVSTSLTFSYPGGSGANRLVVAGAFSDGGITGATHNGAAMTLAGSQLVTGLGVIYLFWLLGQAAGTHDIVISNSGSATIFGCAADYTGVKQSSQPDATTSQQSATGASTLTTPITTVADNSWSILMEGGFTPGSLPPSAGTGSTRRVFDATVGVWGLFDSGVDITPAGSYSMTTNRGGDVGDSIGHVIASFSPVGGGDTLFAQSLIMM